MRGMTYANLCNNLTRVVLCSYQRNNKISYNILSVNCAFLHIVTVFRAATSSDMKKNFTGNSPSLQVAPLLACLERTFLYNTKSSTAMFAV